MNELMDKIKKAKKNREEEQQVAQNDMMLCMCDSVRESVCVWIPLA